MRFTAQRAFTRNYYEGPILYAIGETKAYRTAKTYNVSVGGMYFEADMALAPGTPLYIKFQECAPDPYWPEACDTYFAEVRWCLEKGGDRNTYGIGVRFLMETCRQCGEVIPHHEEHSTGLCKRCFSDISTLSDPMIRAGIENYLIGNVL